jgi:uncharacterized damage-inducible protein DinB
VQSLPDVKRLLAYDAWGNREYLQALLGLSAPPPGAVRLFGHIVGAQRVWLSRLTGKTGPVEVWPSLERSAWAGALAEVSGDWERFLGTLTDEGLGATITYTNSKGEPWTSPVSDVVMHVVMHGVYHRGQLARELRQAGETPPYTDYIHAARQGLLP